MFSNPEEGYSIEEHGFDPAFPGNIERPAYALYYGRGNYSHGLNLCKLSEFDVNGEDTRIKIVEALNEADKKDSLLLECKQFVEHILDECGNVDGEELDDMLEKLKEIK